MLTKRVGLRLGDQDIFVNVVGGLHVNEPAVDLAIAAAIASSYYNRPVHADMAIFGEVGLAGELRTVGQVDRRLREAVKLGFRQVVLPQLRGRAAAAEGLGPGAVQARALAEAIRIALEPQVEAPAETD